MKMGGRLAGSGFGYPGTPRREARRADNYPHRYYSRKQGDFVGLRQNGSSRFEGNATGIGGRFQACAPITTKNFYPNSGYCLFWKGVGSFPLGPPVEKRFGVAESGPDRGRWGVSC